MMDCKWCDPKAPVTYAHVHFNGHVLRWTRVTVDNSTLTWPQPGQQ